MSTRNHYLGYNPIYGISSGIKSLEEVISSPLDNIFYMAKLSSCFILRTVLYHAPTQQSHGKRLREIELDCIPGIIIATSEIFEQRIWLPVI